MKALLIYSGGMDSTVLLNKYKNDIKLAVSFDYGSKHNKTEIRYAIDNAVALRIRHVTIPLLFIGEFFKSSLIQKDIAVPHGHYEDETMRSTVVPFRNGIMLSIAAGLAESNDLDTVLIANHRGDSSIYPDCRAEFINPLTEAIKQGTYKNISLLAPFTGITKRDIALIGKELGVDFSKTWSCYDPQSELHDGLCGTCIERREALEGFDNTTYANL